jgi:two-component system OmpR family sensor kinase
MHRRTPLRLRLVAALLLMVTLGLAGSGIAAVTTLRSYLLARVDSQMIGARPLVQNSLSGTVLSASTGGQSGQGGAGGTGPGGGGPRLPNAYVVEVLGAAGSVVYGPTGVLVDSSQPLPALPHLTAAQSSARGSHSFTTGAVGGGSSWRVLAVPVTLADGTPGTLLIAQTLADVNSTSDHLVVLLTVIGAAVAVVVGGVGYFIVRSSLQPLRDVERTAAQIAAGDLSHRVPGTADPRTEVGGLSLAMNTMLGQIEGAFAQRSASEQAARASEQRMRRFVADASHELRTPLTTIRGFAELDRHRADTDADALARSMRRIEGEAKRMGLLVEDLLTLARLDQQRPLVQEPVDLLALCQDAVDDARMLDPARTVRLVVGSIDSPPVVIGDDARLRQVLANLVANALQHTPSKAAVTVFVRTTRGAVPTAAVAVVDEGPGMSQADSERAFERFYRADAARNRRDGGTGLGLAIVAALVGAHGGTVSLATGPELGAQFDIVLPLANVEAPSGSD